MVPSLALDVPKMMTSDGLREEEEVSLQGKSTACSQHMSVEYAASEPAVAIDAETADAISKALAASFFEDHNRLQAKQSGTATATMQGKTKQPAGH